MLPVSQILPALHQQLNSGDAIVVAPPGAGKSTCLPLSLLTLECFKHKKILMLQPRRLAARNIATYLAKQLNESVGQTIGYRIRGETKVSAHTCIEIVTEGILTRMLQNEPELPDVALVIFDEFHERNIHADFSLALCLEVQQALRDDLRLLVMSATLDVQAIQTLMPQAKLLESQGRTYPVEIEYRVGHSSLPLAENISRVVIEVFAKHQGDGLVFLPGAADINKTAEKLKQHFSADVSVHCLYSELAKQQQDLALQPDKNGKRKIVLATNIAETSLTIEGIEFVVDSGVEKTAVFHLNRGITHLQTKKISQASAIQRAGRAGRLGPGTCYRLWSKEQQDRLTPQSIPEILQTDMSSFMLESAIWGAPVKELSLIDYPTDAQLAQGSDFLKQLGLLDRSQNITPLGRQVHGLSGHPSIAVMLLKSKEISQAHLSLACTLAALFESKDPLPRTSSQIIGAEISARLHFLLTQKNHAIWQIIKQWHKKLNCQLPANPASGWPFEDVAVLVGFAYPQWLAKQRSAERYQLANGAGAVLQRDDALLAQKWLAVGTMTSSDSQQDNAQIRYAEPISLKQIEQHFSHLINQQEMLEWEDTQQKIAAYSIKSLGKITIVKQPLAKPSSQQICDIWQQVITKKGIQDLPFDETTWQFVYRVRLAKELQIEGVLADFSDAGLLASMDSWLLPYLNNVTSWAQLSQCNFSGQLKALLDYPEQQILNEHLPEVLALPSGRNSRLYYFAPRIEDSINEGSESNNTKVTLSVRMQELYGLKQHPKVNKGKLALTIELLSPAQRPLQTTQDLPGFWNGSYKEVQKEMKGRYPRHFWPDDPVNSQATTTTKKRMLMNEQNRA
ncbi:ATP-dependent helicase HrpB [Paraglaciecola aquimarina]|uniref:ATP-dependent helicase HrpB n=1 Tax=Paraglaciecola algarum TaxID=3050085 RepID=A0ABS9D789_9ALTE|nr:ATP-dependent helicase HrpB [Paraglaciecola sp. G1-23]MCF2948779.1 ATP-dependent helicase HrpB [Paraglaciecola sp. G1-23]